MDDFTPLNDVQSLNFKSLSLIRDEALKDLAGACCRFGLSQEQLRAITALSTPDILQIAVSAGGVMLFVPREDIDRLLAAPRTVIPILASARAQRPARAFASRPTA